MDSTAGGHSTGRSADLRLQELLTGWGGHDGADTELRTALQELHARDELFRKMLEIETVGVIFFDPAGDILRANDAFLRMGGYTQEDIAAGRLRWERLTPPEFLEASRRAITQLQTLGSTTPYEKQYYRKDGSRFWGLFAAKGLSAHEGIEFILDITERKRLEEELRRREDELECALERQSLIAGWLQDALRPVLPDAPIPCLLIHAFYRPALDEASVGGDFYDVFPLGDGRHVLVVADLSGKGLAAASQVATVRHMLRALLYQSGHGAVMLSNSVAQLNGMVADHDLLAGFATLFVGVFTPEERTLTYVNAGQEPGLLLRADTGTVEELSPTGPVLGGFSGGTYEERVARLAPGDSLALFTDGLTEAGSSRKDLLGVSGAAAIFQGATAGAHHPAEIAARMVAGVEASAAPVGIRDDVALLVARAE